MAVVTELVPVFIRCSIALAGERLLGPRRGERRGDELVGRKVRTGFPERKLHQTKPGKGERLAPGPRWMGIASEGRWGYEAGGVMRPGRRTSGRGDCAID